MQISTSFKMDQENGGKKEKLNNGEGVPNSKQSPARLCLTKSCITCSCYRPTGLGACHIIVLCNMNMYVHIKVAMQLWGLHEW